jgi:hypothetical protein
MSTLVQSTGPSKSSRNNRRSPRVKINMHVKVWRRAKGEKKLVPGYSRNISQDGIAIFIPAEISAGEKLELQFTLPGLSKQITVHAVVRVVNKFQYGMEFTSLDSTMKRLLAAVAVE